MQEIESEIKEFCKFIGLAYIQRNGKLKLYSDEVNNWLFWNIQLNLIVESI